MKLLLLFAILIAPHTYTFKPNAQIQVELQKAVKWYEENTEESRANADYIVLSMAAEQVRDPQSKYYGSMGWWFGKGQGLNMANFLCDDLFKDLWPYQDRMCEEARKEFRTTCELVVKCAERRFDEETFSIGRDNLEYSNAYCMAVQNMMVGGIRLNDERLIRKAETQWTRLYNYHKFYWFGEFMSPAYDNEDFSAIMDIWRFTRDPKIKAQAKEVLDELYLSECAGSHPELKVQLVGTSRDYRKFLKTKERDQRSKIITATPEDYEIPAKAREIQENRKYPFEFEGKAGTMTFTFKSYQLKDAGMGTMTGWGNYFWQQLHLIAAAGSNENDRATLFIPGSYNPINGFTDQKGMTALIVYNHRPSLWHLTGAKGSVKNVKKTFDPFGVGTSVEFKEIKNSLGELVLSAGEYDFHIYPFEASAENGLQACTLKKEERLYSSPSKRYHYRKLNKFFEYLFPTEPQWVGAVVKIVKKGTKVKAPIVVFDETDGLTRFTCKKEQLEIKVGITEFGASVAIPKENLDLMPLRRISQ